MKNRFSITLMILWVTTTLLFAQQSGTVIPPSPDAAALGQYGNVPVSAYTGIPAINIPIGDIDYGEVHIPVNLSYHAGGVSVEQDASWVGLGWSLNIGGVITRTVKAGDDMEFAKDGISNAGYGYYGYQGYPYDDDTASDYLHNICRKDADPEPDQFYFNFHGKSGSFVLEHHQDKGNNFVVGTPLNVEKIDIRYDKTNLRWQIRTPDGYTYYFATMELTETLHGDINSSSMQPESIHFDPSTKGFLTMEDIVVSSWYLDKVITPSGNEINYIYDVREGTNLPGAGPPVRHSIYGSARISINEIRRKILDNVGEGENPAKPFCMSPLEQTPATKLFTSHIYLKEVLHPLGKIVFEKSSREDMLPTSIPYSNPTFPYEYSNQPPVYMTWLDSQLGAQKLDNIQMFDNTGNKIRQIELKYGYFNASITGKDCYSMKRLKLTAVRECAGSECKPYYQLFYDESHPLPSKYSYAQDFWGYYNGAQENTSRIPMGTYYDMTNNKYIYLGTADRQPNSNYMTTATLNKIGYPTGGSSEFEFEANDYYAFGNEAFSITDFSNNIPLPVSGLINDEDGPAIKTVSFTLTDAVQDVIIDETMTYYESATSVDQCHVLDPGQLYVGNEVWYSLHNTTTNTDVITGWMSDFLDFFTVSRTEHCVNSNTPEQIDPIYHKQRSIVLGPGTYELKVYARQRFNNNIVISKKTAPARVIPTSYDGLFAKTGGGLRIRKIVTREHSTAQALIKEYNYTVPGQFGQRASTGRLMLFPTYHIPHYCNGALNNTSSILGRSWTNVPLGTSAQGSIVGYDQVTEVLLDEAGNSNGKTEYQYINQEEQLVDTPIFLEGFPTKKNTSNGLLSDARRYDRDGNLISSEHHDYERQMENSFKGVIAKLLVLPSVLPFQFMCLDGMFVSLEYFVISDRWVPTRKTQTLYSPNSTSKFVESVTNYEYDTQTHLQIKSEQTTSSKGGTLLTTYTYPSEASWIPATMWQDKFMYGILVKKDLTLNGSAVETYKSFYISQANKFLKNREESSFGATPLEAFNINTYTSSGNIRSIMGRDGLTRIYLWGYNTSYPIAEIKNAQLSQVLSAMGNITEAELDAFAVEIMPSNSYLNKINALRTTMPGATVTTYTYKPLVGITSVTDPNNTTIYYEYDALGRLNLVRDTNKKIIKQNKYHYKN
ncbi:MAG TPA: RHS repeat domain-containing protein [Ohtaekwangia sp.]|uniref:RHS repeat protein n=1 Tax=Ohtaekwangia sp. TaxID=2066019 RepID=UPI002F91FE1F